MSGRGPDPKELRASLVDSGWSIAPPSTNAVDIVPPAADETTTETRRLPNYEDLSQAPAVTQVDTDIQSRLTAMTRRSIADSHRPARPNMPPPPPSRPAPPSLPPPPPPRPAPPAPSNAPLPSFDPPATEPQLPLPSYTAQLRGSDSDPSEATEVQMLGALLPSSQPPALVPPRAPPMPVGLSPSLPAAPSLVAALKQRVRFAGGEVPLWSLLMPMVLLLALGSAFVAAAISGTDGAVAAPASSAAPTPAASLSAPALEDRVSESPTGAATQAPALPANATDAEALEARRAEELSKDEALTLASARRQREITRVALLRQSLTRDPGLFKDAATLTELRRAAEDPLTAPDALSAMAEAPGSLSADLLYEVWTGTVARNSATELARSLVFSKEVRAKASPELAVALELRIAETCEQNKALLPKVLEKGDRRSLALLAKLSRRFGCGANKRQDCYPCLREDKAVDEAMTAVKKRREPKPFSGK
jgi:hypothetical protein